MTKPNHHKLNSFRTFWLALYGFGIFLLAEPAIAKTEQPSNELDMFKVECIDFRRLPVVHVRNDSLNDVAFSDFMRSPGAIFQPMIIINVRRLKQLSKASQAFFVMHECGHHVLGHFYFRQPGLNLEQEADCYALRTLIRQKRFTLSDIKAVQKDMRKFGQASVHHKDGEVRATALMDCI